MEDMDFDQVVDVPDTPDRLPSRQIIGRGSVGKDCNTTLAGNFRNLDSVHGLSGRGKPVTENGVRRKIVFRPPRFGKVERQDSSNSSGFPTVENLSASQNAHLFRRPAVGKNHSHKAKQSIEAQNMDNGKPMCGKFPSKSSIVQEGTAFFDLTKQNGHTQPSKKGFSHGELKYLSPEETNRGQIASNGSYFVSDSVKTSRNAFKGKGKMDDNSVKGSALAMAHGNGVDSQYKSGEQMNVSCPVTSPRVSGQKRLVRNGCISPLNIETKAKQLAEQQNNASKIVEQNQAGKAISNHPSPCYMDTSDIITKDDNSEKVKGKTIVIDPYRSSKEHKAKFVPASSRVPVIENGEANGISAASGDAFGCSTGIGGWRSTRNPSRNVDHPLPDSARHLSRRSDGSGVNCRTKCDHTEDQNTAQTVSCPVSDLEQTTGPPRAGKTIIKRQRNQGSSSKNAGECSTSISEDSDIMIIGSSRGSLKSKSSGVCNPQSQVALGPVIEIDELSPAVRNTRSQSIDDLDNDYTEARARQVEADEMLARELQEQLYHEGPIVGGREIDEHMAWALQREENGLHNSAGSQNESHPRGSRISQLNRQHSSRSSQNLSIRRGTQNRVPTATRMVQLRNRFHRQTHAVSTRARNVQFPLDMDLDMRLDMLEALEAAVEDHSDVGTRRRATNIFRAQRDFNENDYEMLLALDENNHRHAGASANQINSLPQSTVQVETLEEACAICLETPTMGEIVRHLPCLHKFHKDCIDPWLCRKTSCPICKCSVT